jgi:hypothetical protein
LFQHRQIFPNGGRLNEKGEAKSAELNNLAVWLAAKNRSFRPNESICSAKMKVSVPIPEHIRLKNRACLQRGEHDDP